MVNSESTALRTESHLYNPFMVAIFCGLEASPRLLPHLGGDYMGHGRQENPRDHLGPACRRHGPAPQSLSGPVSRPALGPPHPPSEASPHSPGCWYLSGSGHCFPEFLRSLMMSNPFATFLAGALPECTPGYASPLSPISSGLLANFRKNNRLLALPPAPFFRLIP